MADQQNDLVQDNLEVSSGLGNIRRVKIFTVHGTFDNQASWDDWDPVEIDELKTAADVNNKSDGKNRNFVNRLRDHLANEGVTLDEADHTQYNWSGRNSHDERRAGAVGLKKRIQQELQRTYAEKGPNYYNGGVYVIGHSHGGTISRLAMNLWDKTSDYYEPETHIDPVTKRVIYDEFKHDDHCPHCKEERHGKVGPNTVPRPDRVITFGSPFVTFTPRRRGLLAANIMLWVFRALLLIPLITYYLVAIVAYFFVGPSAIQSTLVDAWKALLPFIRPEVEVALQLLVPLALYWLLARYTPRRIVLQIEDWAGKGNLVNAVALTARLVSVGGLVALGAYYALYFVDRQAGVDMWTRVFSHSTTVWLAALVLPIFLYWLLAMSFAGRSLAGLSEEVARLSKRLPTKYDPQGDQQASFLCYHTRGDEPGLGLRLQGFNTWLIQTLVLATVCVLAVGIPMAMVGGLEALSQSWTEHGVLHKVGLSPATPGSQQDRFIWAMDLLTALPAAAATGLSSLPGLPSWVDNVLLADLNLGNLDNKAEVARYVPFAMVSAFATILFGLMPSVLLALLIAFVVNYWLRNSVAGFGAERFAWTLASRIAVSRRANADTMVRMFNIGPEAWWNREIAHCYYYKCESVTKDVAKFIADPGLHKPARPAWPIARILGLMLRWLVVALFVLGMFALVIPTAKGRHAGAMAKGQAAQESRGEVPTAPGLSQPAR